MAMLSLLIDLLQRSSFRRSGTETCAGRSATPRKMSSPAAHLFDARRTLPPHSCQVPQCWAVGRTNGMKRSFFGAVAAARGRTEHSKRRLLEVRRSTVPPHPGTRRYCVVVCLYGEGYASLLACAGGHLASFMYTPFNPNTMPRRALREHTVKRALN